MNATARLFDFARAEHRLPEGVRADALRLLADTLAVGAAGASAPGAAGVLAAAQGWGAGEDARLIGGDGRLPASGAAFVNAFRIHCLEWDAVHEPAVVHALSVVTAALGAAIDRMRGCDPEDALVALAVGVEVASGLGVAATSPLSFFRPAIAGCLGATVAVARIERVAPEDSFGIAYGFASGTMQAHVEGSIALPLQIANAARSAVMAADLVKAGLTGPHDAIEGPFGYFNLFDRGDPGALIEGLGERWRIAEVSTKPYPCGRASHAVLSTLSTVLPRRREPRVAGDALDNPGLPPAREHGISVIEAHVPPLIARLVGRPFGADMTPAYARLCLPFLVALMLTDGRIDPRRFVPDTFADPDIAALAARLTIVVDDNPDPNALSPQRLVIDGVEHAILQTLGSPEAPLSPAQADAKLALARELSPGADPRLFDDPLGYFTGAS